MSTAQLVEDHRRDLDFLIGLATANLEELWAQFGSDFQSARDGLLDVLPELVDTYGSAATALGADWYETTREEAGVGGRFAAVTVALSNREQTNALARWSTKFTGTFEPQVALVKVTGGLQRFVADADRGTIIESAKADPKAVGWRRVGHGACAFCAMLIGRGTVYKETTARFASHDHCQCGAVPAWGGQPEPVNPYTPTIRNVSDADRARVRQWLRDNPSA